MSNYLKIAAVNLKHNTTPHLLLAIVIALLTPVIFGISSLHAQESAQPLEMFLSLTGIVLLTPIFLPEQNENIRDLVRSKRIDHLAICFIRLVYSVIFLACFFGIFTIIMHYCESNVAIQHFTGGFASGIFLGALGFFFAGVSGNSVVGYMVSIMYYIGNFMLKDNLKHWYLFSMSSGNFEEKYWLLGSSAVLFLIAFVIIKKFPVYLHRL